MIISAAFLTAEMYAIEFSLSLKYLYGLSSLAVFATVRATHQPKATQVLSKEFNFELYVDSFIEIR